MSIILDTIIENFGVNEDFTPWDLHKMTKINYKVLQMNLKKMANREVLYHNLTCDIFRLRTDEDIFERRKRVNDWIDQYSLKQKKYKLT
jgi:hypothetical protein